MRSFKSILRRFVGDEDGALIAEAVLLVPLLLWSYLALIVYWDAYRSTNTAQKAAYTISDMISREMNATPLPVSYVTGMRDLLKYLVDTDQAVRLRVTSVTWSQAHNRYEVDWSVSPSNAKPLLTTSNITTVQDRIPVLADGDHVIIVETEVDYHPAFDTGGDLLALRSIGLQDMTMKQFIVTRPRFVSKLCMAGFPCT